MARWTPPPPIFVFPYIFMYRIARDLRYHIVPRLSFEAKADRGKVVVNGEPEKGGGRG